MNRFLGDAGHHPQCSKRGLDPVRSESSLAETITTLSKSFDSDLFAQTKEQLEERWFFAFDASKSVEANIYRFHDMMELYGSFCRRWEEHHNGPCCVVERVRDQYLWPKIKQFADDLRSMMTANNSVAGAGGVP